MRRRTRKKRAGTKIRQIAPNPLAAFAGRGTLAARPGPLPMFLSIKLIEEARAGGSSAAR
jgi:hypothetical protein